MDRMEEEDTHKQDQYKAQDRLSEKHTVGMKMKVHVHQVYYEM